MSTPRPRSGKNASGLPKMLAAGARERGMELLQKEMRAAVGKNDAAFLRNVQRLLKDKTGKGPQEYVTMLERLRLAADGRSLAALLEEGAIPARLPRVPGAPGTAGARDVVESLPTEFTALAQAKVMRDGVAVPVITDAVHAAANRLGSPLPSLYRQLYPALERLRLKRRLKSREGQRWALDGRIAEIALHKDPGVIDAEEKALLAALKQMDPPAERTPPPPARPLPPGSPAARPRPPDEINAANELLKRRRAPGVYEIELTDLRDSAGQLVTDRFRGLIDLRNNPPEIVIVAIGESKTIGGSADILPQLVQDVRRLLKGFQAPLSGRGTRVDFDSTRVRFGPELVVSWLSEKSPPADQIKRLEGRLAAVFRQSRKTPPRIVPKAIDPGRAFQDARIVSAGLQAALQALAAGKSGP